MYHNDSSRHQDRRGQVAAAALGAVPSPAEDCGDRAGAGVAVVSGRLLAGQVQDSRSLCRQGRASLATSIR